MDDNERKTKYDRRGKDKIVLFFPTPAYGHYRIELGLALAVIAAPLEGKYDLHLIDERVPPNDEQEVLKHLDGAVCVGISSITGFQIKRGIAMARKVRAMNPEVPIVWGGYHPSLFPEQCCESTACDIVCVGQGDETFKEIVESLVAGKPPADVQGVAYWTPEGTIVNEPRPLTNINDVPPAPYHLMDVNRAIELNQKTSISVPPNTIPARAARASAVTAPTPSSTSATGPVSTPSVLSTRSNSWSKPTGLTR